MSNRRPNFQSDHLYFITTKASDYAHLFRRDSAKRLMLDTFDFFRLQHRWQLYCFVVMPNHFHCIAQFAADDPLADVLRDLKKHVSDRLIRQLKAEDDKQMLEFIGSKVAKPDKQSYKVWEDGYNAKDVESTGFLLQKMNYIHNNPRQPQWQLSQTPGSYPWSSARFYLTDDSCIIPIDDVRKLLV